MEVIEQGLMLVFWCVFLAMSGAAVMHRGPP